MFEKVKNTLKERKEETKSVILLGVGALAAMAVYNLGYRKGYANGLAETLTVEMFLVEKTGKF